MAVYYATKTMAAIEEKIQSNQGASFRGYLGKVIGHIDDAYRTDEFPFRTHLGASGIGRECARDIWYSFHWTTLEKHGGRLLRLFNRGHMEEGRFIAMLLDIGCEVYQQDEHGKQFKISDAGGHFGGSGDGVVLGVPDLDANTPALAEFKTSALAPFLKIKKNGVRAEKFEHFVQMQMYMGKMGLAVALYMIVNKNNDELHAEIVPFDQNIYNDFLNRGVSLVWQNEEPTRLSESPGWFECKWCDHRPVCHLKKAPHENCRTCKSGTPKEDGKWHCDSVAENTPTEPLTKEEQFEGCNNYTRKF